MNATSRTLRGDHRVSPAQEGYPAIPISPAEQIESTHEAFEVGASLVHINVRNPDETSSSDAELFRQVQKGIVRHGAKPEIEVVDLSHIHGARRLIDEGVVGDAPHVQFVMGIKNALPAHEHLVDTFLDETRRVIPKATWAAAGIGRSQFPVMAWALARECDAVRTGFEDNVRITRDRLVGSNAELVLVSAELCAKHGARPAMPTEARQLLALRPE